MVSLDRFVDAQEAIWDTVLEELAAGRKRSHLRGSSFPRSMDWVKAGCPEGMPSSRPRRLQPTGITRFSGPGLGNASTS